MTFGQQQAGQEPGFDTGAGVPVTLSEVMAQLDPEGSRALELAIAKAQIVRLQQQQAQAQQTQAAVANGDAPTEGPS